MGNWKAMTAKVQVVKAADPWMTAKGKPRWSWRILAEKAPHHPHFRRTSSFFSPPLPLMRKMCPNYDKRDGSDRLETVLEVPIPEELFTSESNKHKRLYYKNPWSRLHLGKTSALVRNTELQLLVGVIGAPLVPLPVSPPHTYICLKQDPMEVSQAKYIVRQYVAAAGGDQAIDGIGSMYAMGKVRMTASEIPVNGKKSPKGGATTGGEIGGFVLWNKRPDVWCFELVFSGCKISAGSDGKVAWRQTPWHPAHVYRGPPRPLRRSLQGLDPRSTANLFMNATCIGEKSINGDNCFVLRLDAEPPTLRARSGNNVEIIRHTLWGYFSHRTGLLVQLDDSHLLRIKGSGDDGAPSVYWETTMESSIDDYRPIDGVYMAHAGRTAVSHFRFGDGSDGHRTRMEERWEVEEVEFNIKGLSTDCFLPPADMKRSEQEGYVDVFAVRSSTSGGYGSVHSSPIRADHRVQSPVGGGGGRIGSSKVAAVEMGGSEVTTTSDDDDE